MWRSIFEPGLFHSAPVGTAILVGSIAAVVSAFVGVVTLMRGQAFAGHALSDLAASGGSAAFLVGAPPVAGFLGIGLLGAASMEVVGVQKARDRDLATGIVLGAGLGLAALFLYLDASLHSTTGAAISVLFGSVFAIAPSTAPFVAIAALVAVVPLVVWFRPLLLATVDADLARVSGIRVRWMGVLHLVALAVAVALSSVSVGAILSTALLIGPAAASSRLARRPGTAIAVAAAISIGAVVLGIVLAYDSFYWSANQTGWPVSFFVVVAVLAAYLVARLIDRGRVS
jgi:zinc/manganese transport system permease protein